MNNNNTDLTLFCFFPCLVVVFFRVSYLFTLLQMHGEERLPKGHDELAALARPRIRPAVHRFRAGPARPDTHRSDGRRKFCPCRFFALRGGAARASERRTAPSAAAERHSGSFYSDAISHTLGEERKKNGSGGGEPALHYPATAAAFSRPFRDIQIHQPE